MELAVSINQELLKARGKISMSYYNSFMELAMFSVFSLEELKTLAATAGFRNRLAHEYLEINPTVALRTMERMLVIYPLYLQKVKKIASSTTQRKK